MVTPVTTSESLRNAVLSFKNVLSIKSGLGEVVPFY